MDPRLSRVRCGICCVVYRGRRHAKQRRTLPKSSRTIYLRYCDLENSAAYGCPCCSVILEGIQSFARSGHSRINTASLTRRLPVNISHARYNYPASTTEIEIAQNVSLKMKGDINLSLEFFVTQGAQALYFHSVHIYHSFAKYYLDATEYFEVGKVHRIGSAIRQRFPLGVPRDPTDLDLVLNRLKSWIEQCTKEHPMCRITSLQSVTLPTRLLDLEVEGAGHSVRLSETGGRLARIQL